MAQSVQKLIQNSKIIAITVSNKGGYAFSSLIKDNSSIRQKGRKQAVFGYGKGEG